MGAAGGGRGPSLWPHSGPPPINRPAAKQKVLRKRKCAPAPAHGVVKGSLEVPAERVDAPRERVAPGRWPLRLGDAGWVCGRGR